MGKARVVSPPPKDFIPEPLVSPLPEIVEEQEWLDGNLEEEIAEIEQTEPSPEELEKERIAQEKYEELQRKKVEEETRLSMELRSLRQTNEKLQQERDSAIKARDENIVAARQKATDQRSTHLNMVEERKPSVWKKIEQFFRKRRIKKATVGIKNYEHAIINQASAAVPKMLDEIEKMHEQLTILEELIAKYVERQKIKDR